MMTIASASESTISVPHLDIGADLFKLAAIHGRAALATWCTLCYKVLHGRGSDRRGSGGTLHREAPGPARSSRPSHRPQRIARRPDSDHRHLRPQNVGG